MLHSLFLVLVFAGLCRSKDGEPLPAKSYQVSCTFADVSCTWVKDASGSGEFMQSSNVANINNPPDGCKYLVHRGSDSHELRSASIQSPEFMTLPSMQLLRVNLSFWMENPGGSASLQLLMVPLEGKANGSQIDVWKTKLDKSSELWNIATINIKKQEAHRIKLILRGSARSSEDAVAINQINLTEITENEKVDVALLPESVIRFTNESTCHNHSAHLRGDRLSLWIVLLSILYALK